MCIRLATGDTCRNDVRHEQQAQSLRREVRGDGRPEPVHVGVAIRSQQGRELGFRIAASRFGLALERAAQLLRRPGLRGVRRVLQELSDDGAANLRVRATLHLRQRRHRILVDDQVIDIHLTETPGGGVKLSDRGHTLMHVSYEHDVDSSCEGARLAARADCSREGN